MIFQWIPLWQGKTNWAITPESDWEQGHPPTRVDVQETGAVEEPIHTAEGRAVRGCGGRKRRIDFCTNIRQTVYSRLIVDFSFCLSPIDGYSVELNSNPKFSYIILIARVVTNTGLSSVILHTTTQLSSYDSSRNTSAPLGPSWILNPRAAL